MRFSVERPFAFYAFLVLIPALAFSIYKYRSLIAAFGAENPAGEAATAARHRRQRFVLRTAFRVLAAACFILAYAGISWGSRFMPVQKNGRAVSFVFDISYSMLAQDAGGGKSRLAAAADYAAALLDKMAGTSVSVVLAKGDGTVAVPMTEDTETVYGLLSCLSPSLMTSAGTSLGKGISAAIASFPAQSSQAGCICLFTDGEETDETLLPALNEAVRYGIPVVVIGFGAEQESEVLAGDGTTKVKTALRSAALQKTLASVQKRNVQENRQQDLPSVQYVAAAEPGSAALLLRTFRLQPAADGTPADNTALAYELQEVSRQNFFMLLGFAFLVLSFVAGELDVFRRRHLHTAAALLLAMLFSGCTPQLRNGARILEGRLDWNRKDYQGAVSCFLDAYENSLQAGDSGTAQYALYGLAATYLMQDEAAATLERFAQIAPDAPDDVRFAVLYNTGILAHRRGDYETAAQCFRDALTIDNSDIDAKINLELSILGHDAREKARESALAPVTISAEEQLLENAMYSIMREKEQEQWKNQEQEMPESGTTDY